jgi:dnd system-associated protein 4
MAVRIRRPAAHKDLLEQLCGDSGNPFNHYYEALLYGAALGYARGAREPFEQADEPIRWDTFLSIEGAAELVDMLASTTVDDRTILSEEGAEQRIAIFEEYANGGLGVIQRAIDASPAKMTRAVILDLALGEQESSAPEVDFDALARGLA